jgi:ABC-type uncharacterized transport system permease subunit
MECVLLYSIFNVLVQGMLYVEKVCKELGHCKATVTTILEWFYEVMARGQNHYEKWCIKQSVSWELNGADVIYVFSIVDKFQE